MLTVSSVMVVMASSMDMPSAIAGYGLQCHLIQVLNLEGEDVAAGLRGDFLAIGIKRYSILIRIDFHFVNGLYPVHKALAADINERFFAPPCFIDIEGILLDLPVKSNQTLMVHAGLAALVAGICGKVEHIPQMGRPHKGALLKEVQHILMVLALVFFRLVTSSG